MPQPARWIALVLSLLATLSAKADGPSWNVVLIVADDLGWSDLACYGNDLHQCQRMEAKGLLFTAGMDVPLPT